jgi:hypothetical protein
MRFQHLPRDGQAHLTRHGEMFSDVVQIKIHLAGIGMREVAVFQIDHDQTTQTAVVKQEIDAVPDVPDADALLPGHKRKAGAQLEQERFEMPDQPKKQSTSTDLLLYSCSDVKHSLGSKIVGSMLEVNRRRIDFLRGRVNNQSAALDRPTQITIGQEHFGQRLVIKSMETRITSPSGIETSAVAGEDPVRALAELEGSLEQECDDGKIIVTRTRSG